MPSAITAEEIEHLSLLGAPPEVIADLASRRQPEAEDFVLWPENQDVFEFFLRCETQWRWSSTSAAAGSLMTGLRSQSVETPIGLDMAGVEAVARMVGVPLPDPALFDALRVCERAFIKAYQEKAKRR